MTKIIIILLLGVFFLVPTVFAQNEATDAASVKYEVVNPDSILYPLKRTWERMVLMFQFTENGRKEYMQQLIEIRFKELVYVANNKKLAEFEEASSRYNSMIGEYTEKFSNTKDKVGESAKKYSSILGQLKEQYNADFAYWSFLKSSQETAQGLENN